MLLHSAWFIADLGVDYLVAGLVSYDASCLAVLAYMASEGEGQTNGGEGVAFSFVMIYKQCGFFLSSCSVDYPHLFLIRWDTGEASSATRSGGACVWMCNDAVSLAPNPHPLLPFPVVTGTRAFGGVRYVGVYSNLIPV